MSSRKCLCCLLALLVFSSKPVYSMTGNIDFGIGQNQLSNSDWKIGGEIDLKKMTNFGIIADVAVHPEFSLVLGIMTGSKDDKYVYEDNTDPTSYYEYDEEKFNLTILDLFFGFRKYFVIPDSKNIKPHIGIGFINRKLTIKEDYYYEYDDYITPSNSMTDQGTFSESKTTTGLFIDTGVKYVMNNFNVGIELMFITGTKISDWPPKDANGFQYRLVLGYTFGGLISE